MNNSNAEKDFVLDDDIVNKVIMCRAGKYADVFNQLRQPAIQSKNQIELMYSSCGTDVFVCQCPATLYFESEQSSMINERPSSSSDEWSLNSSGVTGTPSVGRSPASDQSDVRSGGDYLGKKWTFVATGVPTLVFDRGTSFCRRRKKLQLVLANCRTGFLIFAQNITDRCYYRKTQV